MWFIRHINVGLLNWFIHFQAWGMAALRFRIARLYRACEPTSFHARRAHYSFTQGRPFAMQEATMALAMILQKFNLEFADPDYELEIKQTLTIKPKNFFMHAIPRKDVYTTA